MEILFKFLSAVDSRYFFHLGIKSKVDAIAMRSFGEAFNAEIDIVQKESKKIWLHVGYLFKMNSQEEAIELSVQKIANFLKKGDH